MPTARDSTHDDTRPAIRVSLTDYERLVGLAEAARGGAAATAAALLEELDRAELLQPEAVPADVARMESRITFRDDANGTIREVRLVYPNEADIAAGRISILTPIGAALLGLSPGQSIAWPNRRGDVRRLSVLSVDGADCRTPDSRGPDGRQGAGPL